MKKYTCFLALLSLVLILPGCGESRSLTVSLGEEFSLSPGERVEITGENFQIQFQGVTEDSRCPKGATCVWAGRVSAVIELREGRDKYRMTLIQPGLTNDYAREIYKTFNLAYYVSPYPEMGEKISPEEYRLHLLVSK